MGLFGGSASSSQSLSNSISFNPVVNIGDGNDGETAARQVTRADATATAKDEFGLSASAGLALAPGSSAMGGPASTVGATDIQPTAARQETYDKFMMDNNMPLYIGVGVAALGVFVLLLRKKKKKK